MSAFGATPGPTFHVVRARSSTRCTAPCTSRRRRARRARRRAGDVCEPWPLQSSGFGSGCGTGWRRAGRVGVVGVADEVDAALDLRARAGRTAAGSAGSVSGGERRLVAGRRAGAAEVGVRVVDARVDDGDLDALAVEAVQAVPRGGRADQRDAVRCCRASAAAAGERRRRRRSAPSAFTLFVGDLDLDAVVRRLVRGEHGAAERARLLLDRLLLRLQLTFKRGLVGLRQRRCRVDDGDRIGRHLQDHGRRLVAQAERCDGGREVGDRPSGHDRRVVRGGSCRHDPRARIASATPVASARGLLTRAKRT